MQKNYIWNRSTCISAISRCVESIVDDRVIVCDKIISVADSVLTNVTNTVPTNV